MNSLTLFTPSGVLPKSDKLRRAAKRLSQLGFDVAVDADALARATAGAASATRCRAASRVASSPAKR